MSGEGEETVVATVSALASKKDLEVTWKADSRGYLIASPEDGRVLHRGDTYIWWYSETWTGSYRCDGVIGLR